MSLSNFIYLLNKLACFVGYITLGAMFFMFCLFGALILTRKYVDWRYGKDAGKEI